MYMWKQATRSERESFDFQALVVTLWYKSHNVSYNKNVKLNCMIRLKTRHFLLGTDQLAKPRSTNW